MRRSLCCIAIVLFVGLPLHAATTYYVSPTGSDSGNGGSSQPWATFAHAFTVMHGCDTLIVNDGTYRQWLNVTTQQNGSSACYTTIKAAHDWGATVDGSTTAPQFRGALYMYGLSYIQVRGIKFAANPNDSSGNGPEPVSVLGSDHILLTKLAAFNAPCTGNNAAFDIGPSDSYVTVEDSHAWGCARYKYLAYQSNHIIFRHNVSRHDYHDITGWTRPYSGGSIGGWGRQCATYTMYDSTNVLMQNNISIDSGELDDSTGHLYGGIWSENNAIVDNSGKYEGDIFINIKGYWSTPSVYDPKLIGTREVINVAMANTMGGYWADRQAGAGSPADLLIHHITAVNINGPFNDASRAGGDAVEDDNNTNYTRRITTDSVIQHMQYTGISQYMQSDYNLFYNNPTNYATGSYQGPVPSAGAHDTTANPQLKYITRVEAGTPGSGTASDGGDRGATILYRIGTPGTLWGDAGYDTVTTTSLWPWDDEAVIKTDMASYSFVNPVAGGTISGARGFAAGGNGLYGGPITLTSYVWEQLGNACPSNICAGSSGVTNYVLSANSAGTGSGNISGCTGNYASGATYDCTVTPGTKSTLAGVSGCGGSGAGNYTGTMPASNCTVTATFNLAASSALSLGLGTCSSTMTGAQYLAFAGCTLAASGGTPPYTYSWTQVTDGSFASLPEGLSLGSSTGAISGTAYGQGRYVPQFVVKDSAGATATLSNLVFSLAGNNTLGGCSLFPSDSIFHQRVDSLPVDTSPAAPIYSSYQSAALRVFFGNNGNGNIPNGIPILRVPYNQANAGVTTTLYQSYFTSGPFPDYAPPEGTSNNGANPPDGSGGDRHVLLIQTAGGGNPCRLWEMWQGVKQTNGSWSDASNAYWSNIGSTGSGAYAMLPQGNGATDAAGLPVAPFLVNADEVIGAGTPTAPSGSVQHPIRFTVNNMLNRYVWPATEHAGVGSCSGGYSDGNSMLLQGAGAPTSCTMTGPAGEIYRLKASIATPSCAATSPQAAIIIQGMRNYGIILADNGLSGGLIGTPDTRWNDSDLACLSQLTLGNFEPVAVSGVAAVLTPNYNGSSFSAPVTSYQTIQSTLTGITVAPATASIAAATGTQQYTAQCSYASNGSSDCTSTVVWSSSSPAVGTISSSGLASGVASGNTTITATSGSISGTAVLTVTTGGGPTLTGIAVTPASASIVGGTGTQQYAASCSYSNSTSADCTATVTWSSSNPAAATIATSGLASGVGAGSTTIKATSGSVSGTAALTVTSASITGIAVTPATASIAAGSGTQQYAARCSYSNSTSADCTTTVTWSSSSPTVATISSSGLARGVAAGNTTIKATSGSISGTAALTVTSVSLTGIAVTPATASIVAGTGTQQYTARCSYSNSTSATCTSTVTWSSSSPAVATISGAGLARGVAAGSTTIKATSGSVSGTAILTVTNVSLTSIAVTPATASIASGSGTRQYAARCSYSNSTSASCTSTVTWSSSNPSVATISSAGLARGVAAGSTTIKATSGSVSATSALTVTTGPIVTPSGSWTWMGGSNTVPAADQGKAGEYGSLGTPAASNTPGGRQASVGWSDNSGNLWLFGGGGFDSTGANGYLNDLWEYTPASEEWAWMGGSSTVPSANKGQAGVYGTLGVPEPANSPGGREASAGWVDSSGNFWLFGGLGFDSASADGSLNDLWEFNTSSQTWAWMGGESTIPAASPGQPGVYGTLGTFAAANSPGGRWGANSWSDSSGGLWMFGGIGYDAAGSLGSLNDLWEFDPSARQWSWMGGSNTIGSNGGQPGIYGVPGVFASSNAPSGRSQSAAWIDSNGDFWLFGGKGYDATGTLGYLNDLWKFNPSTRDWAWMSGSSTIGCTACGSRGTYGSQNQAATTNIPGGRNQAAGWADSSGNLWLMGGNGFDSAGTFGLLNDLWEFLPATQEWAWMGGSKTLPAANQGSPGVYGQLGISASGNAPGGRWGAQPWSDKSGNLWLLGGTGIDSANTNGILNDLWVYQLTPGSLSAATPTLSPSSGTYNAIQTVTVADATPGTTIYYTTDGTSPGTASTAYSGPITVSSTVTIQAIAVAKGYGPSAVASATYTLTPSFSIAPKPGSATTVTVHPGGVAAFSLVVTPSGSPTFISPISLSASGLPPGATATFTPGTIAAGTGPTNLSLSVQASKTSALLTPPKSDWKVALCLLLLPLATLRRWRSYSMYLRGHRWMMPAILLLVGAIIAMSGCASAVLNQSGSSTPGEYVVTVTAASGAVHQTTTVTLVLK